MLLPPSDEAERLEVTTAALVELASQACDALISEREREGRALAADLMGHHDYIAERLEQIAELAPGVVAGYEQRLRQRIEMLLEDADVATEPADLVREIAVYAERTDIAEEIARLREHLRHFEDLVSGGDDKPIGRTLDFVSQEMLREANTMASKSPDAAMSRLIVEIKGAIDRIKEQVQNAE